MAVSRLIPSSSWLTQWAAVGVVAVAGLLAPVTASADEPERWLVLPAYADEPEADPLPGELAAALGRVDVQVIDEALAVTLFEELHSSEPKVLSRDEIVQLRSRIDAAILHLSMNELDEAQKKLLSVAALTDRALEDVNRQRGLAEEALSGCIALVRMWVARRQQDEAIDEAMRCRLHHPGVERPLSFQPPQVREAFREAKARIHALPAAALTVRSLAGHRGCRVRFNGIDVGNTPLRAPAAYPSRLRVQVECDDRPGRVHRLELHPGPNELVVDTDLESTLRSNGRLRLVVPESGPTSRAKLAAMARKIGDTVSATSVLLASRDHEAIWLDRLDLASGAVVASVRLRAEPLGAELLTAADHLRAGKSFDLAGVAPRPIDALAMLSPASAVDRGSMSPGARAGLSIVFGALGVGALVTSVVLWNERYGIWYLQETTPTSSPEYPARAADYQRIKVWPELAAIGGTALLSAMVPLWLPQAESVPWWSWLSGAAGLGLVAATVVFTATQNNVCLEYGANGCVTDLTWAGAQLVTAALAPPLLMIPITHLVRRQQAKSRLALDAELSSQRVILRLAGTF